MSEMKKIDMYGEPVDGKGKVDWITVDNGEAVPVAQGQAKAEAIKAHFKKSKKAEESEGLPSKKGRAKSRDELFGIEYKGYNGAAAIEKLLKEKQGHVKNAFVRPEIGGIDVVWGDKTGGLEHVMLRREKAAIYWQRKYKRIRYGKKNPRNNTVGGVQNR